jgi:predicted permease
VVSQVALSLVLLIGAGLLIRNFLQLRGAAPGFDQSHLLTMRISLPPARYAGAAKMTDFYDRLVAAVRNVPGVVATAESSALPVNPARFSPALPEGQPAVALMDRPLFNIQTISPGYVATMRVPLLGGREFTKADDSKAPRVVLVNETVARRFWPHENPVGKHILVGRAVVPSEVVGVIGDLRNLGIAADVQPEIYLPFAQLAWPSMHLVVRTAGDPHGFVNTIRSQVMALDRDQPVTSVQTMDEVLETAAAQPRFTTALLGVLSGTALLLAIVGIYGVISYSVSERTQEMGIRLALGADRADIVRLVLRQALLLTLGGIGAGLAASLALTRLLSSMLYHVSATDPMTFAAGSLVFMAVALAASYFPARRATRVDPLVALRYE